MRQDQSSTQNDSTVAAHPTAPASRAHSKRWRDQSRTGSLNSRLPKPRVCDTKIPMPFGKLIPLPWTRRCLIAPENRVPKLQTIAFSQSQHSRPPHRQSAFTRVELVAVLAALALLGCVAISALANTKSLGDRAACLNNLRQIGLSFQLWASDHGGELPFWTCASEGGTRFYPCPTPNPPPTWFGMQNNLWFQYDWISNELVHASVLTCPADPAANLALDFSRSPDIGFLSGAHRGNAVSYFLGLHAHPGYPQAVLSGDRNLKCNESNVHCSQGGHHCVWHQLDDWQGYLRDTLEDDPYFDPYITFDEASAKVGNGPQPLTA